MDDYKRYIITPRKIRRILRFVKKRRIPIAVTYEWNNSMGHRERRFASGIVESYLVAVAQGDYFHEIWIKITFENGQVSSEHIDSFWEFGKCDHEHTVMFVSNNGPYCYYVFETLERFHRNKFKNNDDKYCCGYWSVCGVHRGCPSCNVIDQESRQSFSEDTWRYLETLNEAIN